MIGWWCASISFWCAAGLLAVVGAVQAVAARREARQSEPPAPQQVGEAAG
jgi:hypothetical protein